MKSEREVQTVFTKGVVKTSEVKTEVSVVQRKYTNGHSNTNGVKAKSDFYKLTDVYTQAARSYTKALAAGRRGYI